MKELTKDINLIQTVESLSKTLKEDKAVGCSEIFQYKENLVKIEVVEHRCFLDDCREADFWQAVEDQIRRFYDNGETERGDALEEFRKNYEHQI